MTNLETDRLLLREIRLADADHILQLLNDPDFILYVADRGVRTRADAATYIADKIRPSYEKFGFGFCLVERKSDRASLGICGLIKREAMEDVDIGFSILRKFWRMGYAFEAASAVMAHGLGELGLKRIVGITSPANERSGKLLEKLGLRFEKTIQLPGFDFESRLFG